MRLPEPATQLTLPMPWQRMRYNLECIGWSQGELSRRSRIEESSVRQMCRGVRPIPDDLAKWVEQLAAIHRALWEPPMWAPKGKAAAIFYVPEHDPDDDEVAPPNRPARVLAERDLVDVWADNAEVGEERVDVETS